MFPDSKIAKNFKCKHTKTTRLLNEAIFPRIRSSLLNCMMDNPFSLTNDGSSDCGISKMNPDGVYIFNINNSNQVEIKFCSMYSTSGEHCSTARTFSQPTKL